ncbi:ribonuclease H, partial [Trifolium medium]|nr:ribonuclease H [Trifolium medium]
EVQIVVESIVKPPAYMDRQGSITLIRWDRPPDGSYKFNVDGSYNKRNASSACGGLLKGSHGNLVQGFYCRLGQSNAHGAKMWGLIYAMRITRNLFFDHIIFETNSTLITTVVLN